ncbi:hypothetical protein B0H16DRAFT_1764987 [Mycena metata]|uniref:Uncharacterized protein n=1 Tax=Mycena metata TaxID=1033252 RepID=A0AAD7I776_9AGAR|nr:hypothetical protein B0H16DRAFT_1764987 [Mycena metata]
MYSQVQAHELIDQFCLVRLVNTRSYTLNAGELLLRAVEDEKPSAALQFKSGTRNVRTMSDAERLNTPRERREWWLLRQMDEREMKDKRIASFLIGENQERDQTHPKGPEASRRLQTQTAEFDIDMSGRENNPYCRPSTPSPLPPCSRHSTPRWADSARIWCSFWVTGAQRLTPALVWVREYSYVILEFCENGSLHNISKHKRRCGGRQSILAPEVIEQRSVGCAQRRDQKSRRIIGATISRRGSRERSCKVVLEKTPAEEDHTGSSAEEDDTASDASHILARVRLMLTCFFLLVRFTLRVDDVLSLMHARPGPLYQQPATRRAYLPLTDPDFIAEVLTGLPRHAALEEGFDHTQLVRPRDVVRQQRGPHPPRPSPSPPLGPNPPPSFCSGSTLSPSPLPPSQPRSLSSVEDVHYAAGPTPWPLKSFSVSPHETQTPAWATQLWETTPRHMCTVPLRTPSSPRYSPLAVPAAQGDRDTTVQRKKRSVVEDRWWQTHPPLYLIQGLQYHKYYIRLLYPCNPVFHFFPLSVPVALKLTPIVLPSPPDTLLHTLSYPAPFR